MVSLSYLVVVGSSVLLKTEDLQSQRGTGKVMKTLTE